MITERAVTAPWRALPPSGRKTTANSQGLQVKTRCARCIVHRLQFEILHGSSLACSAALETCLDRMGSHFCSTPAQHWLLRQAHFSVYHEQKNHLPQTVVPV